MLVASTQNPDSFNIIAEGLDRSYYSLFRSGDTTQYAGNTGIGQVSVANPNLDGSGTLTNILTSDSVLGDGFGCSIKSITIKGIGKESTEGMIRIFIGDGKEEETLYLFLEVPIIYITPNGTTQSILRQINIQTSFSFQAGYNIYVSTENEENFSIMADANDWTYFA